MARKILILLLFCLFLASPLQASTPKISALLRHLEDNYPQSRETISRVSQKHANRIVFSLKDSSVQKGRELLVLKEKKDLPEHFLPLAAVARVESIQRDKAVARIVSAQDSSIQKGDPVAVPSSPVVYLYSNIKDKEGFAPYADLLQKLLDSGYEVQELFQPRVPRNPEQYGILLRLEGKEDTLACRITSLYSGNTLYLESWKAKRDFETRAPLGQPISPAKADEAGKSKRVKKAQTPQEAKPKEPTKNASFRKAPQISSETDKAQGFRQAGDLEERGFYRLEGKYHRVVSCQLDGKGDKELALLGDNSVTAFQFQEGQPKQISNYSYPRKSYKGLHLHSMDIDDDNREELLATLGMETTLGGETTTKLSSSVLAYENQELSPLSRELPYYLRVIQNRAGEEVLLGQRKGKFEPYKDDILKLTWSPKQGGLETSSYPPASNIASVYQFNLLPGYPERIMVLEPSNHLSVYYTPTQEAEFIYGKKFGDFNITPYKIRLKEPEYRGEATIITSKDIYAPRRFVLRKEFDGQCFLIKKERKFVPGILDKVKGAVSSQDEEDSLSALKWNGQRLLRTWQSESLSMDILDFTFYRKGDRDIILLLIRDNQGYALQRVR